MLGQEYGARKLLAQWELQLGPAGSSWETRDQARLDSTALGE
jgi:hypothetical protein